MGVVRVVEKTKTERGGSGGSTEPNAAVKSSHIRAEIAHWLVLQQGNLGTQANLLAKN